MAAIEARIAEFAPDVVIVDYDEKRWRWLADPEFREKVDLVEIIKRGELGTLNARLAQGVLRKLMSPLSADVREDDDVRAAVGAAQAAGCALEFGHRDVEIEGLRAWRRSTVRGRVRIALTLTVRSLRSSRVAHAELSSLRSTFDPASVRQQTRQRLPSPAAQTWLDESERWLAARVLAHEGRVVVVTRAAHRAGLERGFEDAASVDALLEVPQKSLFARVLPWAFSAAIVSAFVLGFAFGDFERMTSALAAWFGANMTLAALGAAAAGGHPWTIAATSVSAPFVSLNPAVGAGMVGALVQAYVKPPTIRDIDRVGDDIAHWRGWWRNRLARILLVFVFANVASTIGSFVALALF